MFKLVPCGEEVEKLLSLKCLSVSFCFSFYFMAFLFFL